MENKQLHTVHYPTRYVVWDLETTGLDPLTCKILEIGAMVVDNGVILSTHKWMLQNNIEIPEEIVKITGITKEIIEAEGKDPKACLGEFIDILKQNSYVNMTHNGFRFDIAFLVNQLKEVMGYDDTSLKAITNFITYRGVDTAVLVKAKKLNKPRLWYQSFKQWADEVMSIKAYGVKYNLSICCDEMGIDKSAVSLHRAGGDVYLTNEIYKKLMSQ